MSLNERLSWLRGSRLLQILTEAERAQVAALAVDRELRRGEPIYHVGDAARDMFFLKRGRVLLSRVAADGREKILGIAAPGDFFGEMMLASDTHTWRSQAFAWSDVLVCRLSRDHLMPLMLRIPKLALEMTRVMAARLLSAEEEIVDLSFSTAESRVINALLRLAPGDGPDGALEITHEQLAHLVGTSRETVTAVLGRLRRQGWLDFTYGRIQLHPERLEKEEAAEPAGGVSRRRKLPAHPSIHP